ncbi:hypothetical protein Pcinc_016195 [Petrolisthes cinctipes]|uniref:Uncharacterized protein n=1 Tax=Petrolisthes cinctipes TaxID=88211 RepID=A0AAE1FSX4_PETCI|nr:hypothetical protein Pcinc_016195 [Petrolisthes cinctipes]
MQSVVVEAEKYSLTTGKGSYTLLGWWRFCYLHSFETKQHTIYWNDKVFSGTSEGPEMVRGGGLLVIGQDQDRMGGGYTFSQSLNAVVADLRLYNRTLTNSEALDFVSCKETHLDPQPLDGQYTCDDGTCISIDHRCDLLAHCPDLTDEINCNTVKLSETYIWELPPPLPDGSPTQVSVFVNITSVRDVSLIDLSISFDMILVFTWRDPRLTFQHLRDNMDQNPVREGVGVWHPEVFMEDGDGSSVDVQVRGRQTFVRRVGPPNPDIPTRLKEGRQSINIQIYPRTVYTMLI